MLLPSSGGGHAAQVSVVHGNRSATRHRQLHAPASRGCALYESLNMLTISIQPHRGLLGRTKSTWCVFSGHTSYLLPESEAVATGTTYFANIHTQQVDGK